MTRPKPPGERLAERRTGPRPLPDGYVGHDEVCRALGIGMSALNMRRRRTPDSVPPMVKFPGGRWGITPAELSAWIAARNLADARELAQRAAEHRRVAAQLEAEAAEALAS